MGDLLASEKIKSKIYTIRGVQVMLDRDLARLYCVEVAYLKRQVKRNIERFPKNFMFGLNKQELEDWRCHFGTSNSDKMGLRYSPYAFTEQGVSMLSGVLRSKTAIQVSISIIDAFVSMRNFISRNADVFMRLDYIERKQLKYQIEADNNFDKLFKALESERPKHGIFYEGQVFDAYRFVSDLIRSANDSIVLIDNYVDDSVLTLFSKRRKGVSVIIHTKNVSKRLNLDVKRFNEQYEPIRINSFDRSHDRFLILDNRCVYHFGASLKDLGKKWFAFCRFEKCAVDMLNML